MVFIQASSRNPPRSMHWLQNNHTEREDYIFFFLLRSRFFWVRSSTALDRGETPEGDGEKKTGVFEVGNVV